MKVFYHGSRVAAHCRFQTAQHNLVVRPEHMPPEYRKYLNYNAEHFTKWAASVSPMTSKAIQYFLTAEKAPEQGFKACASLTRLGDRYGKVRLEHACERILAYSSKPSVRNIGGLLKNRNGKSKQEDGTLEPAVSNRYGITRSTAYFRKGGERK